MLLQLALSIGLVRSEELAKLFGYAGSNDAFRAFCRNMGIVHVPGRPGYFDPILVRLRLDEAQGLTSKGGHDGRTAVHPATAGDHEGDADHALAEWMKKNGQS